MRRTRILVASVVLCVLGALLPLLGMAYVSWKLAMQKEQAQLQRYASRAVAWAHLSFDQADGALRAMAVSSATPCSPEHVAQMRALTVRTRSIEELGYFESGVLKCTSWGPMDRYIVQTPADYTTADGLQVTARMMPVVSRGTPMLAVQRGHYNALINPRRLSDLLADTDVQLAVGSEQGGPAIASTSAVATDLLDSYEALSGSPRQGEYLYGTAGRDGWHAVAARRRADVAPQLRREQMILLPFGLLAAAGIVGWIVWLSRRRLSPLAELARAVERGHFLVHYQPIVDLHTGICVGAEALVRWRGADGLLILPDKFIPLAEESGLVKPITDQVIACVVRDLNHVLAADRSLHIAINLCADDIHSGRFLQVIERALASTRILPAQIWLEAPERGFIEVESACNSVAEARRRGHSVAIDDFGTGYSSLSYLQSLPLDALKIDKSFVDTVGTDAATSTVTPHIIGMARSLGLFTVAEGVETQAQADYLKAHGVDFVQGWLYARALPPEDFIVFYRQSVERHGKGPAILRSEGKRKRDAV